MKRSIAKKIILVLILLLALALFFILDLQQYLSLSYLKQSQEKIRLLYQNHTGVVVAGYIGIYIIVTALSLPGAAVMTLAGGALFGLLLGTVIVSFASSIGATIACAVSRFLLHDWVQDRFSARLHAINEGVRRDGLFYLFSLRLVPVFPFFVINLAMGLTNMSLFSFYWVSQIGMLPGTMVYVNAGKELARIDSLGGILSPRLLLAFTLLGLFPLAARKLLNWYRTRHGAKPLRPQDKDG